MNNEIYQLEELMWKAASSGNKAAFSELVSENAVMVCGGYRCTGAEYSELISDFGISGYEISGFEITAEDEDIIAVHYVVKTSAALPENADLAGTFHVASIWKRLDDKWQLVFNMDSRILEE
ncbi:MAG: nuclear transport factor 2 family protein [Oscillospiraceae bacterium]|nr:nuclear transport factor 2 family protein [Oscillospiraceae bacterium]